jgi:hypothetical protein
LIITENGDKIYYNTLQKSIYNTHVNDTKPTPGHEIDETAKQNRRIAVNIDNIIKNIINFEENIVNKFTLSTARISFWIAIAAVLISILATNL